MRIAVVVPARNEEATVGAVVAALARQDVSGIEPEVIVVDNASSDRTVDVARAAAAAAAAPWIRVVSNPTDRGLAGSLTRGIQETQGDVIVTLHADVVPRGDQWMRSLARAFEAPDVGAAATRVHNRLDALGTVARFFNEGPPHEVLSNKADGYRRAMLDELGGFNTSFHFGGEDVDLGARIHASNWKIAHLRDVEADHIISRASRTAGAYLQKEFQLAAIQPRLWRANGFMTIALFGALVLLAVIDALAWTVQAEWAATLWTIHALVLGAAAALDARWRLGRDAFTIVTVAASGAGLTWWLGLDPPSSPAAVFLLGLAATSLAWNVLRGVLKSLRMRQPVMFPLALVFFPLQEIARAGGFLAGVGGFFRRPARVVAPA